MKLLDLTLPTTAENLALDEALLDDVDQRCERAGAALADVEPGILRLWELPRLAVVLGRSSRAAEEANMAQCAADGVEICRRASGGGAILAGPGCLLYSVVLSLERYPQLRQLDAAHAFVLQRVLEGLGQIPQLSAHNLDNTSELSRQGTSDLTLGPLKFSGNSLRCKRNALLYHGTLLYNFPLNKIEKYLGIPPRQPVYRENRPHGQFVENLPFTGPELRQGLITAWQADKVLDSWPQAQVTQLVQSRYSLESWNLHR